MNRDDWSDFGWYLGGVLLTTPFIAHMFYNMWLDGGYLLARHLTVIPFVPDGVAGVKALLAFGFGLYAGLLFLFGNDYRKRYQGLLLAVATAVVVVGLAIGGIGLVNILSTPINVVFLVIGLVVGIATEGIRIDRLDLKGELRSVDLSKSSFGNAVTTDGEDAQFTIAATTLLWVTVVAVVAGNVLYVAVNDLGTTTTAYAGGYVVATLVFFYFLKGFIDFSDDGDEPDDTTSFEVLGPQQSGKTYLALALYLQVLNNPERYDLKESSQGIRGLISDYNKITGDNGTTDNDADLGWTVGNTVPDEPTSLGFEFEARNRMYPKRVEVNMLDHAGELLDDVSERLAGDTVATDGGKQDENADDSDDDDGVSSSVTLPDDLNGGSGSGTGGGPDGGSGTGGDPDGGDETAAELIGSSSLADDPNTENEDEMDATSIGGIEPSDDTGADGSGDDGEEVVDETGAEVVDEESEEPTEDAADTASTTVSDEAATTEESTADNGPDGTAASKTVETDDDTYDSSDREGAGTTNAVGEPMSKQEKVIQRVANNVEDADKLVVVLDSERFHGYSPDTNTTADMQIEDFAAIVENVDIGDAILVASKADFFIEGWQEENGHQLRPTSNDQRFESFRDHVDDQMRSDLEIKGLAQTVDASTIHPVYFVTEERDDGEIYPKPDEDGNIQPVGFDEALEAIISDA